MATPQVVVGTGDDVTRVDLLARLGILDEAVVGVLVLVVEVLGHALQRPGEAWLVDDVDAATVEPDSAVVLQSSEVFLTGPCSHPSTVHPSLRCR